MKLAESQSKLFEEFSQIIRENRLSHAYLFSGDFGSLDMAIWLAQSRFCVTPENGSTLWSLSSLSLDCTGGLF